MRVYYCTFQSLFLRTISSLLNQYPTYINTTISNNINHTLHILHNRSSIIITHCPISLLCLPRSTTLICFPCLPRSTTLIGLPCLLKSTTLICFRCLPRSTTLICFPCLLKSTTLICFPCLPRSTTPGIIICLLCIARTCPVYNNYY